MVKQFLQKINPDDPAWILDDQNTLKFPLSEKLHKLRFLQDTFFDHPIVSKLLSLLCIVVDVVFFYNLMSIFFPESALKVVIGVIGFTIPFDIGPVYIGSEMIKLEQGIETDPRKRTLIKILAYAFVFAAVLNMVIRILLRTNALPLTLDVKNNYVPLTWANVLWTTIIPILTSVVLFCVSYATTDPLRKKIKDAEERMLLLKARIRQFEGTLAEYVPQEEFKKQLVSNDDQFCLNKLDRIDEKCLSFCYYVRRRLKEHLGDASDLSELSVDVRDQIMAKLFCENKKTEPPQTVESDAVFSVIN